MTDLAAIKDKLRQVDVLSGFYGARQLNDLDALCADLAFNEVAGLVAEIERLKTLLAEPHTCDVDAEQRVIRLAAAIRAEHVRSDGVNVTMNRPSHDHERSIMRCLHPLCLSLGHHGST